MRNMSQARAASLPRSSDAAPARRRPDIQGLRALAVLLVVIFHAGLPMSGGFVGVDVFFVISGFVITGMLLEELHRGQGIDFQQFYLRRIRRLLPALATTSVCVALVAMLANPIGTQVTTAMTGMASALFAANGYLYRSAPGYFSPGAEFNPMLHTWSLAVEEQFYFLFPLLLALAWKLGASIKRAPMRCGSVALMILGMLLVSFWACRAMSYGSPLLPGISSPAQFAFYASPTRAWEFAAGALLALRSGWLKRLPGGLALAAGIAGLLLLGWSAFAIDRSMPFPGWVAWAPVAATLLMLVSGSSRSNLVTQLLSLRALVWIGDRSYGWYLWHWPFVVFARALLPDSGLAPVLASALSLLPAWASYRYVETPLRSSRQPGRRSTLALAAICMLAPLLAFGALLMVNRAIETSDGSRQIGTALQLHVDELRHCEGALALQPGQRERCSWPVPQARGRVLLLGDSNAGHFTEPVVQAANALGYDVSVATLPACPFVDLLAYSNGLPNLGCQSFVADAAIEIGKRPPDLIILATASDGYIEEPSTTLRARADAALARTPDDKAALWSMGLSSLLSRLNRSAPVLVVHPVPRLRTWTLASCAAYKVWLDPLACAGTVGRGEVDAWRRRAVESEHRAVSANPGSSTLELTDSLCSPSRCDVLQQDRFIFRDGAHLSVPGSLTLSDEFRLAIGKSARQ